MLQRVYVQVIVGDEVAKLVVVALQLNVQHFTLVSLFTLVLKSDEAYCESYKQKDNSNKQPLAEREDAV